MSEVPLPTDDTRSDDVDIVAQTLEAIQVVENAPLDVSGATVSVTDDGNHTVTTDPDADLQADIDQMISLLQDIKANTSA